MGLLETDVGARVDSCASGVWTSFSNSRCLTMGDEVATVDSVIYNIISDAQFVLIKVTIE